jgi:MerR family transcriptional regulator, light-induced transcriptional regulator
MNSFTIKDIENLSGIKAHTIRMWEQRYNFLKPCRTCTNIRYYSNDELKKVLNISLLNKYGYKISHINKMQEHEVKEKILTLTQQQAPQEKIINNLIQYMVDLDMQMLEDTIDDYINKEGIEKTIAQIIFPFLERIGILWLTNNINPAQEHLISNIIRQKLILGIENSRPAIKKNKSVLLFLPEGEHHELGLLFIYYLSKNHGLNTIYLGANIPLADVEYIINCKNPHYLFCHLTSVCANFNFDKFIKSSTNKFSGKPLFISGKLTNGYQKKLPPHVHFKKSLTEVMGFLATI